jgi:hypothetical protein
MVVNVSLVQSFTEVHVAMRILTSRDVSVRLKTFGYLLIHLFFEGFCNAGILQTLRNNMWETRHLGNKVLHPGTDAYGEN